MQAIQGLESGVIKIGAFSSVCINWLPDILRNYAKQFPNIAVSLTQDNFSDISQHVAYEELDLGFTLLPVSENVKVTELLRDEIKCVAPANFQPRNGKTITKADLKGVQFMLQKADYDRDTKKRWIFTMFAQIPLTSPLMINQLFQWLKQAWVSVFYLI